MARALSEFSARVARLPADEPDVVIVEIIAAALKPGRGAGEPKKQNAECLHDHKRKSSLVHAAAIAPRPHLKKREGK